MSSDFGYLSQPEMKDFIEAALDLGWTLVPYEADQFKWLSESHGIDFSASDDPHEKTQILQKFQSEFIGMEYSNWREEQQALNIINALRALPENNRLLVWCGNRHLSKHCEQEWIPMGYQFQQHSSINPFVIDQSITVKFGHHGFWHKLIDTYTSELHLYGGTAGLLAEEAQHIFGSDPGEDAVLLSIHNELE